MNDFRKMLFTRNKNIRPLWYYDFNKFYILKMKKIKNKKLWYVPFEWKVKFRNAFHFLEDLNEFKWIIKIFLIAVPFHFICKGIAVLIKKGLLDFWISSSMSLYLKSRSSQENYNCITITFWES